MTIRWTTPPLTSPGTSGQPVLPGQTTGVPSKPTLAQRGSNTPFARAASASGMSRRLGLSALDKMDASSSAGGAVAQDPQAQPTTTPSPSIADKIGKADTPKEFERLAEEISTLPHERQPECRVSLHKRALACLKNMDSAGQEQVRAMASGWRQKMPLGEQTQLAPSLEDLKALTPRILAMPRPQRNAQATALAASAAHSFKELPAKHAMPALDQMRELMAAISFGASSDKTIEPMRKSLVAALCKMVDWSNGQQTIDGPLRLKMQQYAWKMLTELAGSLPRTPEGNAEAQQLLQLVQISAMDNAGRVALAKDPAGVGDALKQSIERVLAQRGMPLHGLPDEFKEFFEGLTELVDFPKSTTGTPRQVADKVAAFARTDVDNERAKIRRALPSNIDDTASNSKEDVDNKVQPKLVNSLKGVASHVLMSRPDAFPQVLPELIKAYGEHIHDRQQLREAVVTILRITHQSGHAGPAVAAATAGQVREAALADGSQTPEEAMHELYEAQADQLLARLLPDIGAAQGAGTWPAS